MKINTLDLKARKIIGGSFSELDEAASIWLLTCMFPYISYFALL
jgi:hypothetical protein